MFNTYDLKSVQRYNKKSKISDISSKITEKYFKVLIFRCEIFDLTCKNSGKRSENR